MGNADKARRTEWARTLLLTVSAPPASAYIGAMSDMGAAPTRWSTLAGRDAAAYQRRFDELAEQGVSVHGEADLVASLTPPKGRILDAGCGTGRVSAELTRRGYRVVGVDADASMVSVARRRDPGTRYLVQDLSELFLRSQTFDVVVLAGNVVPLLAPGTLEEVMRRVAAHVHPGGMVVAGFGLDAEHLPPGCPVTRLRAYETACELAGLKPVLRYGTWDREPWTEDTGYIVAIHHPR